MYVDGHDLAGLGVRTLRRQMGVVMQSSGLLTGDILMNIVGVRDLTVEDAWDAARVAGVERYIRGVPMGMYTVVGKGASSFSGGRRQRLRPGPPRRPPTLAACRGGRARRVGRAR